jgi:hypothetical protein
MISVQIESKQRELFGLLCLHDFYSDRICRDFDFEPTLETAAVLKNYALVFKSVPFGFLVLYNPDNSVSKLRDMPKGMRLSFKVKNRNLNFMNFSAVPFWPEGCLFHYSNADLAQRKVELQAPKDVHYYFRNIGLNDENKQFLSGASHELLSIRPKKFTLSLSAAAQTGGVSYQDLQVLDEFGQAVAPSGAAYKKRFRDCNKDLFRRYVDHEAQKLKSQGLSLEEIQKRIPEIADRVEAELAGSKSDSQVLDLKHVPAGKYTIGWGGNKKEDLYISDNPGEMLFGMIDIFLDGSKNALLNRSAEADTDVVNAQTFVLGFESRQTYWRYFFLNYANSVVSPLSIRDENNGLKFTSPSESMLEQLGTRTIVSESTEPIALKDRPVHVLYLERMNGKRSMKEIRLPTPGPDMVKPVKDGDGAYKLYSDVFVYL